jgi:hypothetical protein
MAPRPDQFDHWMSGNMGVDERGSDHRPHSQMPQSQWPQPGHPRIGSGVDLFYHSDCIGHRMAGNGHNISLPPLRVMISSTSEDLRSYRAAACQAIISVGWAPIMMEYFGALAAPTVKACQDQIANADLVLVIVAHRRGWVPLATEGGDGESSITALELRHAKSLEKPVLIFVADSTWPGDRWEDDAEARGYVKTFRSKLNQPVQFFGAEPERGPESERLPLFRAMVRDELNKHKLRMVLRRNDGEGISEALDLQVNAAGAGLRSGTRIPWLGPGVFGDGPLSTAALINALTSGHNDAAKDLCLATVAEYQELLGTRDDFLIKFREVIAEQTRHASAAAAHRLVANFDKVPFIVSASWDRILEQTFDSLNISYLVISHVLRSSDLACPGKVLVERSSGNASLHVPSELDLRGPERVIYKPMGSPIALPGVDSELELDTVVATEVDHFELFRLLQSQQTGVPTAFKKLLERWPLVFLGYALDVWQYRLITQVLKGVGPKQSKAAPLAVLGRRTPLEDLSWAQLGARVIAMDPNQFASRLMAGEGAKA